MINFLFGMFMTLNAGAILALTCVIISGRLYIKAEYRAGGVIINNLVENVIIYSWMMYIFSYVVLILLWITYHT